MTDASVRAEPRDPFGWAWVWRSLWLRKWQLAAVFLLTVAVYAAGLVLPISTQRAVDMIAAGTVRSELLWLAAGALVAIAVETVLTSLRQGLVIGLGRFLNRRIARKAFLHVMRMRVDLGVFPAGDVLNRFQQAEKIPSFVLQLVPQVAFDAGNAVVSLLLMFYDPRWLRSRIGIVDQDTILFSGTIRENIAGGLTRADDARVRSALAFADALGFIEAMPDGLDSELAENGRNLSGGQRQRLAIARAVIRDPRLVLLDEPTAFLDAEAAVALEKRLAAWGRDRLLLLVTHHLAAARNADAILVLDQGQLVGFGSHAMLLRDCTPYAALWSDYARSLEGELAGARPSGDSAMTMVTS